jgi:hypothetical protein
MSGNNGAAFARALAAKDAATMRGLLADEIDFRALTPGRYWSATSPGQAVDEIILGHWFAAGDVITRLMFATTGRVAECQHVAYRLRVRNDDGDFLVEQQAYYTVADDNRIDWMRILCAGYRRAPDDGPEPAPGYAEACVTTPGGRARRGAG